jgi:hypothetical protein
MGTATRACGGADKDLWGHLGQHVDLLQLEVGAHGDEGWEPALPFDDGRHVLEALVQTAKNRENKGAILHQVPEISQAIRHNFEFAAILDDGETALHKGMELGVEHEDTRLLVADELLLNVQPHHACRWRAGVNDIHQVRRDGAENPRFHRAIHLCPICIRDNVLIDLNQDMVGELIFTKSVEEQCLPLRVVRRAEIKDDGDHSLDVGDSHRQGMERGGGGVRLGSRICLGSSGVDGLQVYVELCPSGAKILQALDGSLGRLDDGRIHLGSMETSKVGTRCRHGDGL